jgi:hypothetical protein
MIQEASLHLLRMSAFNAGDLAAAAGGLKKAETVVKEADLKSQVEGSKVDALKGTTDVQESDIQNAASKLKKAETVVKEASLKDQMDGESVKALAGTNPLGGVDLGAAAAALKKN